MKPKFIVTLSLIFFLTMSCRKEEADQMTTDGYDIILNIGQSNTHYGTDGPYVCEHTHEDIVQLGREGENSMKIIQAIEPLDHHTKVPNGKGFVLKFAELYRQQHLESNRKVLILPCGAAGTGFLNKKWSDNSFLMKDAIDRVNYIYKIAPKSELKVILWHQGENDESNPNYQVELDHFIAGIRKAINNKTVPFILGGMVPFWVNQNSERQTIQNIIKSTPNRIKNTAYADPEVPVVIVKENPTENSIHYDAAGLMQLGKRYFSAYQKIEQ